MSFKRWLYRGGRPNWLASLLNAGWANIHSLGVAPNYLVTLVVVGRKSGKSIRFPLVLTMLNQQRYLVSMLGNDASWVALSKHVAGKRSFSMADVNRFSSKKWTFTSELQLASLSANCPQSERPNFGRQRAPVAEFEKIASKYPVYKVNA